MYGKNSYIASLLRPVTGCIHYTNYVSVNKMSAVTQIKMGFLLLTYNNGFSKTIEGKYLSTKKHFMLFTVNKRYQKLQIK